jgi:S-adenosylmethionine:tRNA ribosyltransferase-isomerase
MLLSDFQYELPESLIARYPVEPRSASRLLHLDGRTGALVDRVVADLPRLLRSGDLLVFNDTRVVPARLFGAKESGGKVELLLERLLGGPRAIVQLRASKSAKPGTRIHVTGGALATVTGRDGDFWVVEFDAPASEVFEQHGEMPLPPYIDRQAEPLDRERYQTVYARTPGAVAAPTAGLHFDTTLLDACRAAGAEFAYVTLHVGAGTFQPVRVQQITEHRMHAELLQVDAATVLAVEAARARGSRVIAVGTTAVRALETAAQGGQLAAGGDVDEDDVRGELDDRMCRSSRAPKAAPLRV